MPIRWDGNPEPIKQQHLIRQIVTLPDYSLMRASRYIDIPPDETESLTVTVRIVDDADAYGWTNESYLHNWKHPKYHFPTGDYIVRVVITAGDSVTRQEFKFTNPEEFECFDLIRL